MTVAGGRTEASSANRAATYSPRFRSPRSERKASSRAGPAKNQYQNTQPLRPLPLALAAALALGLAAVTRGAGSISGSASASSSTSTISSTSGSSSSTVSSSGSRASGIAATASASPGATFFSTSLKSAALRKSTLGGGA